MFPQLALVRKLRTWKDDPTDPFDYVRHWLKKNEMVLICLSIIMGGSFSAAEIANSKMLHMPFFYMGLAKSEIRFIQFSRMSIVMFIEV